MIKGHTALEVERVYTQANELCREVGDNRQRFSSLVSMWRLYINRAELLTGRELAEECINLAKHIQDPLLLQESHYMLGQTLLFRGEFTLARVHLEQGIAIYDAQQDHTRAFSSGMHSGVACLSCLAWTLWMLGYPDQALTLSNKTLTLAQSISHPFSLCYAMQYAALIYQSRREAKLVQVQADATIALAQKHGFVQWLAGGKFTRGWALAEQAFPQEGIAQLRQGIAIWETLGTSLGQTHMLFRLAEAYRRGGLPREGLRLLDEALAIKDAREERHVEAEIYRLKGELLMIQDSTSRNDEEAEACLRQAYELARHRETKSQELRAVMSLCRLWQQQGKRMEARRLLVDSYSWFTEGFETVDLQEAQELLDVLT
jgi:tetratricopeptide (TPR) repeat protein